LQFFRIERVRAHEELPYAALVMNGREEGGMNCREQGGGHKTLPYGMAVVDALVDMK
jgi:hypothetical protein